MKSLGVYYWYVEMLRCGYVEHGLEYFSFYVQKHLAHLADRSVLDPPLVRDGPLGAPAFLKLVYCTIIDSDDGHSPVRHLAIIWTDTGLFFRNEHRWNSNWDAMIFIQENAFENNRYWHFVSDSMCSEIPPYRYCDVKLIVIYLYTSANGSLA